MRIFQWWRWFALLTLAISLPVGIELASGRHAGTTKVKAADDNPNKFYLSRTGKEFSVRYTYDPHAADLWMFRTAEGHLTAASRE